MNNPQLPFTDPLLRELVESRMERNMSLVPPHMRDSIRLYVFNRIEPGDFLYAVLTNNLTEAAARADNINFPNLGRWAQFCMWALPAGCWGSPERVSDWLNPKSPDPEASEPDGDL